ncbi:hypothetical protein DIPPA_35541 [Diplonema papillatum]|nr:hypothetical protein DIPPA_35541 [Diplonema papillatum]
MARFVQTALKAFVSRPAQRKMLAECNELLGAAEKPFYSKEHHNAYLAPPGDAGSPPAEGDPRTRLLRSKKRLIAGDLLLGHSLLPDLYTELLPVVGSAVGKPLYPHGDVMNRFYYNVYDPDDQLAWHFDNSSFGVVLLLQAADGGGLLQFGPDTEGLKDSDAPEARGVVADYLDGQRGGSTVEMQPGDVIVFNGASYLHRVTPVKAGRRINVIFCYGGAPDERIEDDTKRQFFGRA